MFIASHAPGALDAVAEDGFLLSRIRSTPWQRDRATEYVVRFTPASPVYERQGLRNGKWDWTGGDLRKGPPYVEKQPNSIHDHGQVRWGSQRRSPCG